MNNENPYIYKIVEDTAMDLERKTQDQVKIIVLIGFSDLWKHSVKNPKLGCDGTFYIVTEELNDDMRYELNTLVSRDALTGKTYVVIRSLCSRKTTAARKVMFRCLIREMREFWL